MPRLVDESEVERLRNTPEAQKLAEQMCRIADYFKHSAYKRCRELYTAALLEAKLSQDEEFFVGLFLRTELEKEFESAFLSLTKPQKDFN